MLYFIFTVLVSRFESLDICSLLWYHYLDFRLNRIKTISLKDFFLIITGVGRFFKSGEFSLLVIFSFLDLLSAELVSFLVTMMLSIRFKLFARCSFWGNSPLQGLSKLPLHTAVSVLVLELEDGWLVVLTLLFVHNEVVVRLFS